MFRDRGALVEPARACPGRRQVAVASGIKVVVMPIIAYLLARYTFNMDRLGLFAVVTSATLPTGQNVFNFAARYDRGLVVARDTVLLPTAASIPAVLLIAALLG